jgi:hypothetical protein
MVFNKIIPAALMMIVRDVPVNIIADKVFCRSYSSLVDLVSTNQSVYSIAVSRDEKRNTDVVSGIHWVNMITAREFSECLFGSYQGTVYFPKYGDMSRRWLKKPGDGCVDCRKSRRHRCNTHVRQHTQVGMEIEFRRKVMQSKPSRYWSLSSVLKHMDISQECFDIAAEFASTLCNTFKPSSHVRNTLYSTRPTESSKTLPAIGLIEDITGVTLDELRTIAGKFSKNNSATPEEAILSATKTPDDIEFIELIKESQPLTNALTERSECPRGVSCALHVKNCDSNNQPLSCPHGNHCKRFVTLADVSVRWLNKMTKTKGVVAGHTIIMPYWYIHPSLFEYARTVGVSYDLLSVTLPSRSSKKSHVQCYEFMHINCKHMYDVWSAESGCDFTNAVSEWSSRYGVTKHYKRKMIDWYIGRSELFATITPAKLELFISLSARLHSTTQSENHALAKNNYNVNQVPLPIKRSAHLDPITNTSHGPTSLLTRTYCPTCDFTFAHDIPENHEFSDQHVGSALLKTSSDHKYVIEQPGATVSICEFARVLRNSDEKLIAGVYIFRDLMFELYQRMLKTTSDIEVSMIQTDTKLSATVKKYHGILHEPFIRSSEICDTFSRPRVLTCPKCQDGSNGSDLCSLCHNAAARASYPKSQLCPTAAPFIVGFQG